MTSTRLRIAEEVAAAAHTGQVDKQGQPYIGHAEAVAAAAGRIAAAAGLPPEQITEATVVGWIHDVIEDAPNGIALVGLLGPATMASARTLTKRKGEQYAAYIERIAATGGIPRIVKVADLWHNTRPERTFPGTERLAPRYAAALATLQGQELIEAAGL